MVARGSHDALLSTHKFISCENRTMSEHEHKRDKRTRIDRREARHRLSNRPHEFSRHPDAVDGSTFPWLEQLRLVIVRVQLGG